VQNKQTQPIHSTFQGINNLSMQISVGDASLSWEILSSSDEEDSDDEQSKWDAIFSDFEQDEFKDLPLKFNPEFRKYFRILQSGLSKNAVRQLMKKDGKEKDLCILNFNPDLPLDRKKLNQHRCRNQMGKMKKKKNSNHRSNKEQILSLLKDDPQYSQYFEMLRAGKHVQIVKEAMDIDGREPSVIDLDPNLPLETQKDKLSGSAMANIAMNKIRNSLARSSLPISSSLDMNFSLSIARQAWKRNLDNGQIDSDNDDSSSVQSLGSISSLASASAQANAAVLAHIKKALMEIEQEKDEEKEVQKLANLCAVMENSVEWGEISQ